MANKIVRFQCARPSGAFAPFPLIGALDLDTDECKFGQGKRVPYLELGDEFHAVVNNKQEKLVLSQNVPGWVQMIVTQGTNVTQIPIERL